MCIRATLVAYAGLRINAYSYLKVLLYSLYHLPKSRSDIIHDNLSNFTVALDTSLRKGSCKDFMIYVNFCHDIFRYLLNNKTTLYHNDFDSKYFKEGQDQCFSNYRDDDVYSIGHKLAYPVICRM